MCLSYTVSEMQRDIGKNRRPHMHLASQLEVIPLESHPDLLLQTNSVPRLLPCSVDCVTIGSIVYHKTAILRQQSLPPAGVRMLLPLHTTVTKRGVPWRIRWKL